MNRHIAAIDIGGTAIEFGVLFELSSDVGPTPSIGRERYFQSLTYLSPPLHFLFSKHRMKTER